MLYGFDLISMTEETDVSSVQESAFTDELEGGSALQSDPQPEKQEVSEKAFAPAQITDSTSNPIIYPVHVGTIYT